VPEPAPSAADWNENGNYARLVDFDISARGDDWDATMRVILEKI